MAMSVVVLSPSLLEMYRRFSPERRYISDKLLGVVYQKTVCFTARLSHILKFAICVYSSAARYCL